MKELGLNGSSLDKMIAGGAGNQAPVISQEQVDEAKADSSPNVKNRKNPQQKLPIAQEEGAG